MTFIGRDLVSNVTREISRNLDGVSGTAGRVGSNFTSGMARAGNAVVGLAQLVVGMGLTVGAGLLYASNKAAEFTQNVQLLVNHANLAAGEIGAMESGLMTLSQTTGYSATELSTSVFWLESVRTAGESVAQTLAKQQLAAQLARVSNADLSDATRALVTVWTSGAAKGMSFSDMTGVVNATVAEGVMKLDDLTTALKGSLGPVLAELNIPLDQAGAALDMMTRATGNAASGATGLRNSLIFLSSDSKTTHNALKELGLSAETIRQELGSGHMVDAFTQIGTAINKLPNGADKMRLLAEIFSRTRGAAAGAALTMDLQTFGDLVTTIDQKGKEFQSDWNAYTATPAQNIHVLTSNWSNFVTAVGMGFNTAILPVLANMSGGLSGLASWFTSNQGSVTGFFQGIGNVAKTVGDYFVGEWPKIAPTVGKIGDALGNVYNNIMVPLGDWLVRTGVPFFEQLGQSIVDVATGVLGPFSGAFKWFIGFLNDHSGEVKFFASVIADMFVASKVTAWASAISGSAMKAASGLVGVLTMGQVSPGWGTKAGAGAATGGAVAKTVMADAEQATGGMLTKLSGVMNMLPLVGGAAVGAALLITENWGTISDAFKTSTEKLGEFQTALSDSRYQSQLAAAASFNPQSFVQSVSTAGPLPSQAEGSSVSDAVQHTQWLQWSMGNAQAQLAKDTAAAKSVYIASDNGGFGNDPAGKGRTMSYSPAVETDQLAIGKLATQLKGSMPAEVTKNWETFSGAAQVMLQTLSGETGSGASDFLVALKAHAGNAEEALRSMTSTDPLIQQMQQSLDKFRGLDMSNTVSGFDNLKNAILQTEDPTRQATAEGQAYADQLAREMYPNLYAANGELQREANILTGGSVPALQAMINANPSVVQGLIDQHDKAKLAADEWATYANSAARAAHNAIVASGSATGGVWINADGSRGTTLKADGGPVTQNTPYIVGEVGPELFVPGASGTIIPHNVLAAARSSSRGPIAQAASTDRTDELCSLLGQILQAVQHDQPVANAQIAPQPGVQAALYNAIAEAQAARKRGSRGF